MREILGIDSGGSKTRVVHASFSEGTEEGLYNIREGLLKPYNYRQDGISGLGRLIREILSVFRIENLDDTLLLGGFSGAGTARSHSDIQRVFENHGFCSSLTNIISDADLLLIAIGNEGMVLSAGTGCICVGRRKSLGHREERKVRAGGYGFRAYSEPGGYQLGMRAIDLALRIEDGREQEPTVLYTGIKDYFGVSCLGEIASAIYPRAAKKSNVNREIAGIAKLVLKAAHEGDNTATHLVRELVDSFADHIRAVYNKLGLKNPLVGLHGGLFADPNGEELLIRPLKRHRSLHKHDLRFITLGVGEKDLDPLLEAMTRKISEIRGHYAQL